MFLRNLPMMSVRHSKYLTYNNVNWPTGRLLLRRSFINQSLRTSSSSSLFSFLSFVTADHIVQVSLCNLQSHLISLLPNFNLKSHIFTFPDISFLDFSFLVNFGYKAAKSQIHVNICLQAVKHGNVLPDPITFSNGVPQGSGPGLFYFIVDITSICEWIHLWQ